MEITQENKNEIKEKINTDINNIDNEQYWQLAEFDTFCNTRCTDMQVVETITRTLI